MTVSNKVQTLANDFAASTSTLANKVQFFTEALGGVASTSNKTVLFDFEFPRGFGVGPVFQGVAQTLRAAGIGPTFQGTAAVLRSFGIGPIFQGTTADLPLVAADLTQTLGKQAGRPYGQTDGSVRLLGESLGVDLTSAGAGSLFVTPGGRQSVVSYVTVTCVSATAVTVVASARIENNTKVLLSNQPLLGLDAADKVWMWPLPVGTMVVTAGGGTTSFRVTSPATATTQLADIRLYGYLI